MISAIRAYEHYREACVNRGVTPRTLDALRDDAVRTDAELAGWLITVSGRLLASEGRTHEPEDSDSET